MVHATLHLKESQGSWTLPGHIRNCHSATWLDGGSDYQWIRRCSDPLLRCSWSVRSVQLSSIQTLMTDVGLMVPYIFPQRLFPLRNSVVAFALFALFVYSPAIVISRPQVDWSTQLYRLVHSPLDHKPIRIDHCWHCITTQYTQCCSSVKFNHGHFQDRSTLHVSEGCFCFLPGVVVDQLAD